MEFTIMPDQPEQDRNDAVELASALQNRVDDIFAENSFLRAEADSLRAEAAALRDENAALRNQVEQRTRQRDANCNALGVLDDAMRKIHATSTEAMRALHPREKERLPTPVAVAAAPLPPGRPSAAAIPIPTMASRSSPH
jgi:hypothetical protein